MMGGVALLVAFSYFGSFLVYCPFPLAVALPQGLALSSLTAHSRQLSMVVLRDDDGENDGRHAEL